MDAPICPNCGKPVGCIEGSRLLVVHHERAFYIHNGEVECTRWVRKSVRGDGTVRMGPCRTMVTVEVREPTRV